MFIRTTSARILKLLALFAVFACGLHAATKDDVRIVSISPPLNKALHAGDTVNLEVRVEYHVPGAELRRILVTISRLEDKHSENLASWSQIVANGKDVLTIQSPVRVPETGRVAVWAAVEDVISSGKSSVLDSDWKRYDVVDRSGQRTKGRGSFKVRRQIVIPKGVGSQLDVRAWLSPPANATDVRTYKIAPVDKQ